MILWPVTTRSIQSLAAATKDEISRRVSEKVYLELRNGNYLESGYIAKCANEIAKEAFGIQFLALPDIDAYRIIGKLNDYGK